MVKTLINRRAVLGSCLAMPFVRKAAFAGVINPAGGDQTAMLQKAIVDAGKSGGIVQLGAGTFRTDVLTVKYNITIQGLPGLTTLMSTGGGKIFSIRSASSVNLQGLHLSAKSDKGNLLTAEGIENLIVQDCNFEGGEAGIRAASCGGRIIGSRFRFQEDAGCQIIDSKAFSVRGNHLSDISNNGIQVWRSEKGEDGTVVTENHISRIASKAGGDGQNGNGISVFRAGNVIVANNRLTDCAFSGVRNNSGSHAVVTGNSISRCNEVAVFMEFAFEGAIVSNNMIESVAHGISITNFDNGGRLAQCTGNVLQNLKGFDAAGGPLGGGILVEADTVVANNAIDTADIYGIRLGWGPFGRNLSATNNVLRNCKQGIQFSAVGEGPYQITNNIISGSQAGAIIGMDHDKMITGDLAQPGETAPQQATISNNVVKS